MFSGCSIPHYETINKIKKVNENIAKAIHSIYSEEADAAGINRPQWLDKTTFKATN